MFAARTNRLLHSSASRAFSTTRSSALSRMSLIGRLADTPEAQPTSTGREVVRYAVGVSSGPKDENGVRQTSWFRVASFQEGVARDLLCSQPKGTLIHVEADASMSTFEASDGSKQTRMNLTQRSFEILSKPRTQTTDAESEISAAEEPLSGIGQS